MTPVQHLVAACAVMVGLTFVVGLRMFRVRVGEMMARRIDPQSVALSAQRERRLEDSRASDNFNHLFELPVLAWLFVLTRIAHSIIQCSYNRVMHRFAVFLAGFFLLVAMWAMYALAFIATGAALG